MIALDRTKGTDTESIGYGTGSDTNERIILDCGKHVVLSRGLHVPDAKGRKSALSGSRRIKEESSLQRPELAACGAEIPQ